MTSRSKASKEEEIDDVTELIEELASLAESYPYLDEYKILVIEGCPHPFIVMNPFDFRDLERKVIGSG